MRYLIIVAVVGLGILALVHPAAAPSWSAPAPAASSPPHRHTRRRSRAAVLPTPGQLVVYVVGAVRWPGLFRLAPGARIDDAVRRAGGVTPAADPAGVDLAAPLHDGDEVLVPKLGQVVRLGRRLPNGRVRRTSSSRSRKRKAAPGQPLDLNRADASQLARLPGIGETLARRIIAFRTANGGFRSPDELLDVAGFSPSRLDRISAYLRVGAPSPR